MKTSVVSLIGNRIELLLEEDGEIAGDDIAQEDNVFKFSTKLHGGFSLTRAAFAYHLRVGYSYRDMVLHDLPFSVFLMKDGGHPNRDFLAVRQLYFCPIDDPAHRAFHKGTQFASLELYAVRLLPLRFVHPKMAENVYFAISKHPNLDKSTTK